MPASIASAAALFGLYLSPKYCTSSATISEALEAYGSWWKITALSM